MKTSPRQRAAAGASATADSDAPIVTLEQLLAAGRSVLVQRAGVVALKNKGQALRVGLFASWEDRIKRTMKQQGLTSAREAERIIRGLEAAQKRYFSSNHGADPEDESIYDVCIDTSSDHINMASLKVARASASGGWASRYSAPSSLQPSL